MIIVQRLLDSPTDRRFFEQKYAFSITRKLDEKSSVICLLIYIYIYIIVEKSTYDLTWVWNFFNNYSNHPRMCVLSTVCGNVDKHSPFHIYIYIYMYIYPHIHRRNTKICVNARSFLCGFAFIVFNTEACTKWSLFFRRHYCVQWDMLRGKLY